MLTKETLDKICRILDTIDPNKKNSELVHELGVRILIGSMIALVLSMLLGLIMPEALARRAVFGSGFVFVWSVVTFVGAQANIDFGWDNNWFKRNLTNHSFSLEEFGYEWHRRVTFSLGWWITFAGVSALLPVAIWLIW